MQFELDVLEAPAGTQLRTLDFLYQIDGTESRSQPLLTTYKLDFFHVQGNKTIISSSQFILFIA